MAEDIPEAVSDVSIGVDVEHMGVVIVDHGSTRSESNDMLLRVVELFSQQSPYSIVEPAHMELAEPSIPTAFDRCVARGARCVAVSPYFLLPGKHWHTDIPALTEEAAKHHPGVSYLVTAPLGLHQLIAQVIQSRIDRCLQHVEGQAPACEVCQGTDHCQIREG